MVKINTYISYGSFSKEFCLTGIFYWATATSFDHKPAQTLVDTGGLGVLVLGVAKYEQAFPGTVG